MVDDDTALESQKPYLYSAPCYFKYYIHFIKLQVLLEDQLCFVQNVFSVRLLTTIYTVDAIINCICAIDMLFKRHIEEILGVLFRFV